MLNVVTALACILLMVISLYPGAIQALFMTVMVLAIIVSPLLAVAAIILFFVPARRTHVALRGLRQLMTPALMVFFTLLLVVFYVPRRLAFIAVQPLFDEAVSQTPRAPYHREVNRWIGPYHVDEHAVDQRGGVYFRVVTHSDGFIDTFSYGFAYQPNRDGSPFGDAYYRLRPLTGEWYWFRVSND